MELKKMLDAVRNNLIQFATIRPPGSKFAAIERSVIVSGPPELVELSRMKDSEVLKELTNLLRDRDKAWAAEVLLAAITHHEEKVVDAFMTAPEEWWESVGRTAYDRWNAWLRANKYIN
jgi:hypothetical protein